MYGLRISAVAGSVVGLIFGLLPDDGTLDIENWKRLYSAGRFSFVALWTVPLIIIGGIGTILFADATTSHCQSATRPIQIGQRTPR